MIAILDILTPKPPFVDDEELPPDDGGGGGEPPDHGGSEEGETGQGQDYWLLRKRNREVLMAAIMAMEADD